MFFLLILLFFLGIPSLVQSRTQGEKHSVQISKSIGYIYSTGAQGDTPLHWAAFNGDEMAVLRLLRQSANVNARVRNGNTPLHHAAFRGHESIVRFLIDHGAKVNSRTTDGLTPLDWAIQNKHQDVILLLTFRGAKVGKTTGLAQQAKTIAVKPVKRVVSKQTKRFRVQLVARSTKSGALDSLADLKKVYSEILGSLSFNIEAVEHGGRLFYRVQAGPLSKASASSVCRTLLQRKQDCFVVHLM